MIGSFALRALALAGQRLLGPMHRHRQTFEHPPGDVVLPLPEPWTDPRWFAGDFPPRRHNDIRPLHDGETYFAALCAALLGAKQRVTIAAWSLTPYMPLLRGDRQAESVLIDVLRDVSERAEVYILLWGGAPLRLGPSETAALHVRDLFAEHAPRVHFQLDRRARLSHDHHQKAVTVDGRIAFVGGIDVTTFEGDRWDTTDHPLRFGWNWHDMMTQLQGEVVHDVQDNFCQRWNGVTGERLTPLTPDAISPTWQTPAQVVRTVPAGFYSFADRGIYGIFHAMTSAIRSAERYVYLENQYLWAPEIVDALCEAIKKPRSGPFQIALVLPARAKEGRYDNDRHVDILNDVDGGRGIFRAYTLYTSGPGMGLTGFAERPIYVHAKVSIVDDEWFSVGSANLNRRGLATDTEMNIHGIDAAVARELRTELWAHHLGLDRERIAQADPLELLKHDWPARARSSTNVAAEGLTHSIPKLREYRPGRTPANRILDLVQDLTLEH